ncbi:MAG: YHYH protein [Polaribacter sp.]|nr:YHYH protein [Polaribacter sp.]
MTKLKLSIFGLSLLATSLILSSCNNEDESETVTPTPVTPTTSVSILNTVQAKYKSMVTISTSGSSITLKSNGTPDHVSPYWDATNALYEAQMSGSTVNPGMIGTQNYVMTISTNPTEAITKEATTLGPIGMALNGVPIYNDREGGNVPVDAGVLGSFDRAGAHPGPGNTYHYHCTGDFTGNDDSNLIGFLRDGFPIYARKDNDGSYPTNLDANGGHVGTTADFSTAIYHYHASNTAYLGSRFYILKAGSYHGAKGTFTQ